MQRVIGYVEVEKDVPIFYPTSWSGKQGTFRNLKAVTVKRNVLRPVYEDLGPARADRNMITQWHQGGLWR